MISVKQQKCKNCNIIIYPPALQYSKFSRSLKNLLKGRIDKFRADKLFEDLVEDFVVGRHAAFFELPVFFQQRFALRGQTGTFLAVGVYDLPV